MSARRTVLRLPDLEDGKMDPPEEGTNRIELPNLVGDEEEAVAAVVTAGQRFLFKHPVAAQALYRGLVADGRRFAETGEGRAWRARLEASAAIRRLRPLWEAATFNVLESRGDSLLPSQLIELVAQALSHADVEKTTAFLNERSAGALDERR